ARTPSVIGGRTPADEAGRCCDSAISDGVGAGGGPGTAAERCCSACPDPDDAPPVLAGAAWRDHGSWVEFGAVRGVVSARVRLACAGRPLPPGSPESWPGSAEVFCGPGGGGL